MSAARRRAKAIARREYVTELTHRREDRAFFEHGTIPDSARSVSLCSCGAASYTRDPHGFTNEELDNWESVHSFCDYGWGDTE